MSWRDFFYFSKGERRALIVLLSLIVAAATILIVNNKTVDKTDESVQKTDVSYHVEPQHENASDTSSIVETQPKQTGISSTPKKNETVKERVERMKSIARPSYPRTEKFKVGTVVELNSADTATLKKVPGIGSTFANRIVKYRRLLGGFYSVSQLGEVYGIDEERYASLVPWFTVDTLLVNKILINQIPQDSLRRHPYIDYKQAKAISNLRRQKGRLSGLENLQLLEEFSDIDRERLSHYISFE